MNVLLESLNLLLKYLDHPDVVSRADKTYTQKVFILSSANWELYIKQLKLVLQYVDYAEFGSYCKSGNFQR